MTSGSLPPITALGPQREQPRVPGLLLDAGIDCAALISAGWELDESRDDWLSERYPGELINLRLFERTEALFDSHPELLEGLRKRQDELRTVRDRYRTRLRHVLAAARAVLRMRDEDDHLAVEQEDALESVRRVDALYLQRVNAIVEAWDQELIEPHPGVAAARREVEEALAPAAAVVVAGGHVGVLLNRMRLFGFPRIAGDRPWVAWSAGAMLLGGRIVLFHDRPPQGRGDAEVFRSGFGLLDNVVFLPRARERLELDDQVRVMLMARRFAPDRCLCLESASRFPVDPADPSGFARMLTASGLLREAPGA